MCRPRCTAAVSTCSRCPASTLQILTLAQTLALTLAQTLVLALVLALALAQTLTLALAQALALALTLGTDLCRALQVPDIEAVIDGRSENSPFLLPESPGPMANHSARPNAVLSYELRGTTSIAQGTMLLVALESIPAGSGSKQ